MSEQHGDKGYLARRVSVLTLYVLAILALAARAGQLELFDNDFLQNQADARQLRVIEIPAHRGMITDRNGEPLAISTPVQSVWANPQKLMLASDRLGALARVLRLRPDHLRRMVASRGNREFVYLKRHVRPEIARKVVALGLPGVGLKPEYQRFYPAGEVAAHVVGFTNIDDHGQEGLELAYDKWLSGKPGAERVVRDGRGRVVEELEMLRPMRPGKPLTLSLDRRIQYLAYRELKAAVVADRAHSASLVLLDARTGEVLAMVNQPSYNPNNRSGREGARMRNRAVTDVFEPGSTVKPFTIACGLENGVIRPNTVIDTTPGLYRVGRKVIRDDGNYGRLDITHIIAKSSNIGAAKIALSMKPEQLWSVLNQVGFGQITASGFPGESSGVLTDYREWNRIEQATMAYGYGLSVTPLQLAQAYAIIAADGVRRPVSFLKVDVPPKGQQVLTPQAASEVRRMMEAVVSREGTAYRARVAGYQVAGKTGTVHKAVAGGYAADHYMAIFAGMAPASRPRLVMVVMVNDPTEDGYFGGLVAAPIFSKVMAGALRLLGVPPDDLPVHEAAGKRPGNPA